VVRILSLHRTT